MGRAGHDPENPAPQQQEAPPVRYPTQQPATVIIESLPQPQPQPQPPPPPQEEPLLCNGLGLGWLLFIIGFFTGIPWYVGAVLLFCGKDKREKPGFIACLVLAAICTTAIIINVAVAASASGSASRGRNYSYYSPPSYYYPYSPPSYYHPYSPPSYYYYYSPPSFDYSYFFPSPPPPGHK